MRHLIHRESEKRRRKRRAQAQLDMRSYERTREALARAVLRAGGDATAA